MIAGTSAIAAPSASAAAQAPSISFFRPGNLLVSRSVYTARPGSIAPGKTVLPPGCTTGCVLATASGAYPQVRAPRSSRLAAGLSAPSSPAPDPGRQLQRHPAGRQGGDPLLTSPIAFDPPQLQAKGAFPASRPR